MGEILGYSYSVNSDGTIVGLLDYRATPESEITTHPFSLPAGSVVTRQLILETHEATPQPAQGV